MENPYKIDDKVMTKVKGSDVEAVVSQIFNKEVEVKTADGKLLWRTMHTVWVPGSEPIPKPAKAVPAPQVAQPVAASTPATDVAGATANEPQASPEVHVEPATSEVAAPSEPAPEPTADLPAEPAPEHMENHAPDQDRKGRGHGKAGKRRNRGR